MSLVAGVLSAKLAAAGIVLLVATALAPSGIVAQSPERRVEVEGVGAIRDGDEARARDEALVDAYRRALETAGVYVRSRTEVRNFQVLIDEVTARASGFVRSLFIVSERREGSLYRVRIKAAVVQGDLADHPEALRIIVEMMGKPTVVVALAGPGEYSEITEAEIANKFTDASYHVLDQTYVPRTAVARLLNREDRKQVIRAAVATRADILVLGALSVRALGITRVGTEALHSAAAVLRYRVNVGATGQAMTSGLRRAGGLGLSADGAAEEASRLVGERLGEELVWLVARRYSPLLNGTRGIQIMVMEPEVIGLQKILSRIRSIRGVGDNAWLRWYDSAVAVVDVRFPYPLGSLLRALGDTGFRVVEAQANRIVVQAR